MKKIASGFLILLLSTVAHAKARYLNCPVKNPRTVRVPLDDVLIMQFPEKPEHSLAGKNAFDFKYIGSDIGIKSVKPNAKSNLFVYLGKKRCAFRLITVNSKSDDVVVVSYPKEKFVEVKYAD